MRYLGIDHGDKRVGTAFSDEEGKIAFPLSTIANDHSLFKSLGSIVKKEGISKIIVGIPFSSKGEETRQSKKVREFAALLHKKLSLPVEFENELLTTRLAEVEGIKKELADASAAAIILQSYLDKQNRNRI